MECDSVLGGPQGLQLCIAPSFFALALEKLHCTFLVVSSWMHVFVDTSQRGVTKDSGQGEYVNSGLGRRNSRHEETALKIEPD